MEYVTHPMSAKGRSKPTPSGLPATAAATATAVGKGPLTADEPVLSADYSVGA